MEASYQTAALTASGLSWAAVQQLSAISGGLETRRPKIDLRSRWINPNKGSNFHLSSGRLTGVRRTLERCIGRWRALTAPKLLPDDDLLGRIDAVDLEHVLG